MEHEYYVVQLDEHIEASVSSLDPLEFKKLLISGGFKLKNGEPLQLRKSAINKMMVAFQRAVVQGRFRLVGSGIYTTRGNEV
jgi:hypothetical protein